MRARVCLCACVRACVRACVCVCFRECTLNELTEYILFVVFLVCCSSIAAIKLSSWDLDPRDTLIVFAYENTSLGTFQSLL